MNNPFLLTMRSLPPLLKLDLFVLVLYRVSGISLVDGKDMGSILRFEPLLNQISWLREIPYIYIYIHIYICIYIYVYTYIYTYYIYIYS